MGCINTYRKHLDRRNSYMGRNNEGMGRQIECVDSLDVGTAVADVEIYEVDIL